MFNCLYPIFTYFLAPCKFIGICEVILSLHWECLISILVWFKSVLWKLISCLEFLNETELKNVLQECTSSTMDIASWAPFLPAHPDLLNCTKCSYRHTYPSCMQAATGQKCPLLTKHWGWWDSGKHCPEMLWMSCQCKCSKWGWTGLWVTWPSERCPSHGGGFGLNGL